MNDKLDPRILIEDARYRHAAVVALINSLDAQAMRLMRLYVTIGIAAAAGAVSAFFGKSPSFPSSVGWALAAADLTLMVGAWFCFKVMASTPISLPGRAAEFWLWALTDDVSGEQALRAYLENLRDKTAQNDALNIAMVKKMKWAKVAGIVAPIVALIAGLLAATLSAVA